MKFFFIAILIFFSNSILANEEGDESVEVINLYESKSLDQMVLENLNGEEEINRERFPMGTIDAIETGVQTVVPVFVD
mgnify:CR=1 FL=1